MCDYVIVYHLNLYINKFPNIISFAANYSMCKSQTKPPRVRKYNDFDFDKYKYYGQTLKNFCFILT